MARRLRKFWPWWRRWKAGASAPGHLAEQHAALALRGLGGLDQRHGDLLGRGVGVLHHRGGDVLHQAALLLERAAFENIDDDFRHTVLLPGPTWAPCCRAHYRKLAPPAQQDADNSRRIAAMR